MSQRPGPYPARKDVAQPGRFRAAQVPEILGSYTTLARHVATSAARLVRYSRGVMHKTRFPSLVLDCVNALEARQTEPHGDDANVGE